MKTQTKKIFAREFLISLVAVGLGFITFVLIYFYNSYLEIKILNLTDSISKKTLIAENLSKQYNLYKYAAIMFDEQGFPIPFYREISRLNDNGQIRLVEKVFPPSAIDSLNHQKSLLIIEEVKLLTRQKNSYKSKLLTQSAQTSLSFKVLILCVIFLFGFRYLFYGTKWSIKTLQQKS